MVLMTMIVIILYNCDDYDDWDDYGVKGWRYPNPGQQSHDMFRQIVSDMADILSPGLRW